jgi:hypothetical protein
LNRSVDLCWRSGNAFYCYQQHYRALGRKKKLFDAADTWFFGVSDHVFGFENICAGLNLDANYVRSLLKRWRDSQPAQRDGDMRPRTNLSYEDSQRNEGRRVRGLKITESVFRNRRLP